MHFLQSMVAKLSALIDIVLSRRNEEAVPQIPISFRKMSDSLLMLTISNAALKSRSTQTVAKLLSNSFKVSKISYRSQDLSTIILFLFIIVLNTLKL